MDAVPFRQLSTQLCLSKADVITRLRWPKAVKFFAGAQTGSSSALFRTSWSMQLPLPAVHFTQWLYFLMVKSFAGEITMKDSARCQQAFV
jgi:hypothetical protein